MRILKSVPIIMSFNSRFSAWWGILPFSSFDLRYEKIMLIKAVAGMFDA